MNDRVFLVRHGEAAASWGQDPDPPLSDDGRAQARTAAQRLTGLATASSLISSPLRRAQETAAPLAEVLKVPVLIDNRVAEIPAPVPLAERQDWLRAFMRQRWSHQPEELLLWRGAILEAVFELPAGAVVFSHFLVINTIVGSLQGADNTLVCWPANASITVLERDGGQWLLAELGAQMRSRVN